ncbi:hypothetical protein [Aquabacterium sp. OR-4]|uniref:hypothetical protein n=1 Tax=Aquabacterium sp. OR-4 TaxID=2978127 RepID=UPI0028CAD266|nr:hypothetical protein [Aquabacterium sp. OR-4]MDT7837500.1 hypothetical protein [Aquabacterium sp. OR-4]
MAVLSALFLGLPAGAQMARNFPATALRGTLQITQPPEALLNGQAVRLAPGGRIRDLQNMQQLSGQLVGEKLAVHYTLEPGTGLVKDVWILRADELAKKPWPTTADEAAKWTFDPLAQTWTKP